MTQKPTDVLSQLFKAATDHFQTVPDEPCPPEADLRDYYLAFKEGLSGDQLPTPLLRRVEEHVDLHCGICYKKIWDWLLEDSLRAARVLVEQNSKDLSEN